MKKLQRIVLLLLLATAAMELNALPWKKSPMSDSNGEYVIYRDHSWKSETYAGILYYNDSTYALMLKTPESKTTLLISVTQKNSTVTISGVRQLETISGDDYSEKYLLELFQTLVDARIRINADIFPEPVVGSSQIEMFGGLVSMQYQYYIPVFNLEQITATGNANTVLFELIQVGRLTSNEDRSFFDFTPALWNTEAEATYNDVHLDPNCKKISINTSGITIQLDTQWAAAKDQNYFLKNDKKNAAMITVCTIDGNATEITGMYDFVRLFTRSTSELVYDPAKTIITTTKDDGTTQLIIENTAIDTVHKIRNKSFAVVTTKSDNGNLYALITMSIIDPVYRNSQTYFDNIRSYFYGW